MIQFTISLILSVSLVGQLNAQSVHDETCSKIQKQGVASCFDKTTLGFCLLVGNEWRAVEAATCDSRLCCNAKMMGCTIDADCADEWTTAPTTTIGSTNSTVKPGVECAIGKLKKHESDCKRYYFCSGNVWKEGVCSAGVFDENRMSCAFGSCNESLN